ncbi:MAG TPA: hypothetical protein VK835_00345 [Bacteroidia bacterium]|jgi:hypothetical protein|nr:hypothetical protein [Bacteroidia bacterium]
MKIFFARYILLLLVVGKMYSQRNTSQLNIQKKDSKIFDVGLISGKINNVYAGGIYVSIISPPLGASKFSLGFDVAYLTRKTSNTFGTVYKKPELTGGFIDFKCHYSFNVTEKILVSPGIAIGIAHVGLVDESNYHQSQVNTLSEYLFTVMPMMNFKYICTKKRGGIICSVKYQKFPFLGKHYFSSPQNNEGFIFSIGWEGPF